MRRWLMGLLLIGGLGTAVADAAETCEALIEQSNVQLEAMRRHAEAIQDSLQGLNDALQRAEQRNAEQTRQIERLEAELRAQRVRDPGEQERLVRDFFYTLRRQLPVSALYEILPDRLIIASDPVFVFGKGELGAEGQDRLTPLVDTLAALVARLPAEFAWRLRVEGHSDSRPLRSNPKFESNWDLSAARSVSMLRFLVSRGLPEDRLSAVGLADTQLRDPGDSKAAHRRNRRIEIHLIYLPTPSD
ncbi:MAG: OmpA family protein [Chromatiaceae bacterium]|nr:OmpA family protein [Chromatiaceae bacterium]